MQIDLTGQIAGVKQATKAWAERVGYTPPLPTPELTLSTKARNVVRVLEVSSFGCQQESVRALCAVLLDEELPKPKRHLPESFLYAHGGSIELGIMLATVDNKVGFCYRKSASGKYVLRLSDWSDLGRTLRISDVRPASDDEIDSWFSEYFSVHIRFEAGKTIPPVEDDFVRKAIPTKESDFF